MEFKGRIDKVFAVQSCTSQRGNEWRKQEFVFEYFEHETDRYSDKVVLSLAGDRIAEKDLHEGDECVVGFGHTVREWQGRWFNELRVYKVEKVSTAIQKGGGEGLTETRTVETVVTAEPPKDGVKEGDLPF
jgi:hypothetical protein